MTRRRGDLTAVFLSLASKRRFMTCETAFGEDVGMARVSERSGFKTTERQRMSAQTTRKARTKARKPQSRAVDEALSAAVATVSLWILREDKRAKAAGFVVEAVQPKQITDWILEAAVDHLVDVRSMDKTKSLSALHDRLKKPRRYR